MGRARFCDGPATGDEAYLETVPVATAGIYTVTVGAASGTGGYTLGLDLNAAIEAQYHNGPADNSFASAQSLDSAFTALGSASQRAAVLGTTDGYGNSVFASWNMDTNPGWTAQGQWAYGQPTGKGGGFGYPDPTSGHTGNDVEGVNLNGNYSTTSGPQYLTTTAINCSGQTNVQLSFWRWLNTDNSPYATATVEVSNDGHNWTTVYANPTDSPVADSSWQFMQYDISAVANNQPTVYVRWGYSVTAAAFPYSGWNIDDVSLSGQAASFYSFSLLAGQSLTVGMSSLQGDNPTLNLYDSGHNLLASGVSSAI